MVTGFRNNQSGSDQGGQLPAGRLIFRTNQARTPRPLRSCAVEAKDSINRITLSNGEQTRSFDPRVERNAMRNSEHFRPHKTALAVNDRIVWNRPDPARQLVNGDVLMIEHIVKGKAVALTPAETRIMIDLRSKEADQHWEHAYATILYKSQGKTADRVLVDAPLRDSALMDHHAFLVGVSRHNSEVKLYTDDPDTLAERIIRNPSDKTSAVEGRAEMRLEALRASLQIVAKAFGGPEPEAILSSPEPDPRSILSPDPALRVAREELQQRAREQTEILEPERSRGMSMGM